MREWQQRLPMAEVTVRFGDLAPQHAEVRLHIEPQGELAAIYGVGAAHDAAVEAFLAAINREVRTALDILYKSRNTEPSPDSDAQPTG